MAEDVVDALEVVDVDVQHRRVAALALGHRERVEDAVAAERAVRQAGQRVVQRLLAHLLLEVQAREADRQHVGDGLQERALLLAERALRRRCGHERAVHAVAGVDRDADLARGALQRAPGGDLARPVEHLHALHAEHGAHPLGGLLAELARGEAAQRALAERGHHRLLLGLPAQPLLGLEPLGDVAADRQQQRAVLALHDAPAHLADELAAVLAPAVGALGEAQRVIELEVELQVAFVALAQAFRPQDLDRLADQLLAVVAELLLGQPVAEHDPAVARRPDGGVGQTLEHREQRDVAATQRIRHGGLRFHGSTRGVREMGIVSLHLRHESSRSGVAARWRYDRGRVHDLPSRAAARSRAPGGRGRGDCRRGRRRVPALPGPARRRGVRGQDGADLRGGRPLRHARADAGELVRRRVHRGAVRATTPPARRAR